MKRILAQVLVSVIAAFGVLFWYHSVRSYGPGAQVNDALQCLIAWGHDKDGQLSFDFTGVVAERLGWLGNDPRYLTIIGKDEDTGAVQNVYCKVTDREITVSPYTGKPVTVQR